MFSEILALHIDFEALFSDDARLELVEAEVHRVLFLEKAAGLLTGMPHLLRLL